MPQPSKVESRLPHTKEFVFPLDEEARKKNPKHDPCKITVRGELSDGMENAINEATGRMEVDKEGKLRFFNSPFAYDAAILDAVLADELTTWNLVDGEGDEVPVTAENFEKQLAKADRRGLRKAFSDWYMPQIMDLQLAEPDPKDVESDDPNSDASQDATTTGSKGSTS